MLVEYSLYVIWFFVCVVCEAYSVWKLLTAELENDVAIGYVGVVIFCTMSAVTALSLMK